MVQSLAPETHKKNGSTARFVGEKAAGQVFPDKANGFEPHRPQAQSVIQNECGPGTKTQSSAWRWWGGTWAGSSSVAPALAGFYWNCVWKLKCPPKIRHFFWRFAHNSLPLRRNITRRGMEVDTRCPVCWRLDEDGGHCFLKCKYVKECWRALNLEDIRMDLCGLSSAKQVVGHILKLNEERKPWLLVSCGHGGTLGTNVMQGNKDNHQMWWSTELAW